MAYGGVEGAQASNLLGNRRFSLQEEEPSKTEDSLLRRRHSQGQGHYSIQKLFRGARDTTDGIITEQSVSQYYLKKLDTQHLPNVLDLKNLAERNIKCCSCQLRWAIACPSEDSSVAHPILPRSRRLSSALSSFSATSTSTTMETAETSEFDGFCADCHYYYYIILLSQIALDSGSVLNSTLVPSEEYIDTTQEHQDEFIQPIGELRLLELIEDLKRLLENKTPIEEMDAALFQRCKILFNKLKYIGKLEPKDSSLSLQQLIYIRKYLDFKNFLALPQEYKAQICAFFSLPECYLHELEKYMVPNLLENGKHWVTRLYYYFRDLSPVSASNWATALLFSGTFSAIKNGISCSRDEGNFKESDSCEELIFNLLQLIGPSAILAICISYQGVCKHLQKKKILHYKNQSHIQK